MKNVAQERRQPYVIWHEGYVQPEDFERRNGHRGAVVWFTGLSGAGKSTIAREVEWRLFEMGKHVFVLDGDNVRHGLNRDLGFSPKDREENIRRVGEVAKLFRNAGMIVLTAFISPYRKDREQVRKLLPEGDFLEIYVKCGVDTCIQRDPKGLYQKALRGEIPEFTGISAPYEPPEDPELVLDTEQMSVEECVDAVIDLLDRRGILSNPSSV